jgi:uncharacterized protein YgbK (DUF1537 family)
MYRPDSSFVPVASVSESNQSGTPEGKTELVVTARIQQKISALQEKLGAQSLDEALEKSLNIAYFVAETMNDQQARLLVERGGKFTQLKEIA